jgi:hypothetical protein
MTKVEYENFLQELDKHNKLLEDGKAIKNFVFFLQDVGYCESAYTIEKNTDS